MNTEHDTDATEPEPESGTSPPEAFDSRAFLRTVTTRPGVYRMLDADGDIIYVGKAGNLRARLSSYFNKVVDSIKTARLVAKIAGVDVTVTRTAAEALVLENQLIKQHRPRYNVLMRDDKSYPYVYISTEDTYPRVSYHRGARKKPGEFFGPYPHSRAVRKTLSFVQKLFQVRQCEDSYFKNRSRPCLQHQIKRCRAPCVGLVSEADYRADVELTVRVLNGQNQAVLDELVVDMNRAAEAQDYERAAVLRDRITDLKHITDQQFVEGKAGNVDVIACATDRGQACIQLFSIRNGLNLGNTAFFPRMPADATAEEALYRFVVQNYLDHGAPPQLILSHRVAEVDVLATVLSEQAGHKVGISDAVRGERARWLDMARNNAELALAQHLSSRAGQLERFEALTRTLGLDSVPERIECFDISHTQGEATVGSCVVFDREGPARRAYRRFDVKGVTAGDDYAAMHQVLTRRYTRLLDENKSLPDLVLIDGGKGQLGVAEAVFDSLGLQSVALVAVSKGAARRPGDEVLILSYRNGETMQLASDSAALHLIQHVRDESHRHAIAGHRGKRGRARRRSVLEDIKGLGAKRRQALLTYFGGIQALQRASVEEIARVPGISRTLGQGVYDYFHDK
ncbi:MAG: excinuclease ABC subunit UvrC [Pseudomonadota bacterium]